MLTFDLDYSDYIHLNCEINGIKRWCSYLVDTQADISVFKSTAIAGTVEVDGKNIINIKGITHDSIKTLGTLQINIYTENDILGHEFHVVPEQFNIDCDGIIGKDFLTYYRCKIDYDNMTFTINNKYRNILKLTQGPNELTMTIPPRCEVVRKFNIETNQECVVDQTILAPGVYTARTVVNPNDAYIRVINTTNEPHIIAKTITNAEPLKNFDVYQASKVEKHTERVKELKRIVQNKVPKQYKEKLNGLIEQFADVFALPNDKMSINNFYTQKLRISDDNPTYIKNYRTPHTQKEEIRKQIEKLEQNELIEPCASNYNSPLILVPKKSTDGTKRWRMCLDYRAVNKKLVADKFPLPRIDDILDNLGRAVLFSVIDLYSGFHQIPLDKESRDITAFSTENGSFRWTVLPFGLNISPNSFMRMMNMAFSGISPEKLFIYVDDIIVLGKSEQDHLKNLSDTLRRCRDRNLKINPEKCNFFRTEVLFLGHLCTAHGIKPDPSKYETIKNYPTPKDGDSVRRFVAMANYYRKFIPNFSITSIPLNQLTKKNVVFKWNVEHDTAFKKIKTMLCNPVILAYPNFDEQFTLTVDASKQGCGAVLSQNDNPIAFASKSFTRAESNKATIEQELIAICWSIKHFKHYLYGTEFLVQSDHKPLVYLYKLKETNAKLTRLRLELAEFNFSIEHIKGKENVVADALSRIHINEIRSEKETEKDLNELQILMLTRAQARKKEQIEADSRNRSENKIDNELIEPNIMLAINIEDIKGIPTIHTQEMENAQGLIKYIISVHHKYNSEYFAKCEIEFTECNMFTKQLLRKLVEISKELQLRKIKIHTNEVLFKRILINTFKEIGNEMNLENLKIRLAEPKIEITSKTEIEALLKKYHDDPLTGGHCGVTRMTKKMNVKYKWKGMNADIVKYVRNCMNCKLNKARPNTVEPMVITDTPSRSFEKISIDTIGPLQKSENSNRYALTMMCELTKYLVVAPIPTKDANTVAKSIMQNLILIHGPIKCIMTDQGTEYVNSIFKELCKELGTEHKTSTAYHHQTLGTIERNHRVYNEYLRNYLINDTDWEEWLRFFSYCYNSTPHTSFNCNYTPYELVYGRKCSLPVYTQKDTIDPIYNIDNYAKEAKYRFQIMSQTAREMLIQNKIRTKQLYDRKINSIELEIGDKVIVKNEAGHKHDSVYKGPFTVMEINESNITIKDDKNKIKIVHKNNVNKCQNEQK